VTPARRGFPHRRALTASALLAVLFCPIGLAANGSCHPLDQHGQPPLHGWRQSAPGQREISPAALARLDYDDNGLAVLMAGRQHYYVRRDARYLAVITGDNGPDYVEEDLVRAVVGGKLGYYNVQLQPALAARSDRGFPFNSGVAEVCNGCRDNGPDANGHRARVDGQRFRIDRQGKRLTSLR
jgi:hypothetical protein